MELSHQDIVAYYEELPRSGGFDSRCKMYRPGGLDCATIIDLGCRRGKGTYKLSDLAGPRGKVIGVDWNGGFIEDAREGEPHAMERNGLTKSNMEFIVSYPEELIHAGIEEESVGVVYVNSILNLFLDPAEVIKQIGRLLKPAGSLYCQTVLATRPRDSQVVAEARKMGNSVQAAPFRKDFARWLNKAGFDMPTYDTIESAPIKPNAGVDENNPAPFVETDEDVSFASCVVRVDKLGGFDYQEFLRQDISQFR